MLLCGSNLGRLHNAILTYHDDYNAYPKHLSYLAKYPFVRNNAHILFKCPFKSNNHVLSIAAIDEETDYLYRAPVTSSDTLPILADKVDNHGLQSIFVLFAEGSIELKEVTPKTIGLMKQAFGDTAFSQLHIDHNSPGKLRGDHIGRIERSRCHEDDAFLIIAVNVSLILCLVAVMEISRYGKKYSLTSEHTESKASGIRSIIVKYTLLIMLVFLLLVFLLPALQKAL